MEGESSDDEFGFEDENPTDEVSLSTENCHIEVDSPETLEED